MFKELNKANPNLNYDVNFGSYASRDTFITMCFEAGVDWKTILQFVGQSSYTIMDRYIKLFDSYKQKQTDKLNDYVNKQNP
jgi:integrase